MAKEHPDKESGFQRYFLVTILVLLLALLFAFISPFGVDLLFAGIIATAVFPLHRHLLKALSFSRSLAASISMILIIIIILLPFTLFGFFAVNQAGDAYTVVSERINVIVENNDVSSPSKIYAMIPFTDKIENVLEYLPISAADLLQTAGDLVGTVSTFLLSKTTEILKHLSLLVIHLIVFLMALFFFLRDGDRLVLYIRSLLPLSKVYRQELFTKLSHLSYGIIYGLFGTAIVQGFLVGVGFYFAGISNAAFWGSIAALFSPMPYIGTTIIWLPGVITLAVGGHYLTAFLLLAWCMLIVGTADNIIKPILIGSSTALHPLATLLVLLGGTFVFGLKGLIFGPLVLTVTLSFLHIYQLEYKAVLEKDEKDLLSKGLFNIKKMARRSSKKA